MNKIFLIAQREFNQRVRKRSFLLTTILTPLLIVGMTVGVSLLAVRGIAGSSPARQLVVVDPSDAVASQLSDTPSLTFTATALPYDSVRNQDQYKQAFGFLVVGPGVIDDPSQLTLYTRQASSPSFEQELKGQVSEAIRHERIERMGIPQLDSLFRQASVRVSLSTFQIDDDSKSEKATVSGFSKGLSTMLGMLIYFFVLMYGVAVMNGILEEKNSRIVEVIVSSVKPFQLMAGKIIGQGVVALTQFFIWLVLVGAGVILSASLISSGGESVASAPGLVSALSVMTDLPYMAGVVSLFLLYFVGGYLFYAALYAAIGSAVDNPADTQQLQWPITIPLIFGFIFSMQMDDPSAGSIVAFSQIPFFSPIVMMARVPYGVPAWQLISSLVLLYGSAAGVIWFAGKVYRTGIFMYGKKPSWKELIRWSRYRS